MESLNFQNGQVIGKQELINWNLQLRESITAIISRLSAKGANSMGVLLINKTPLDSDLLVSLGTNQVGGYNTIKVNSGWGVGCISDADVDPVISAHIGNLNGVPKTLNYLSHYAPFYTLEQDNIPIPGIETLILGDKRYVCVHPKFTVFEDGTCNISTSNQVTFSKTGIASKLRDQTSNSPTKLRFFTDSATPYNGGEVYEVVSVIDESNVVISGQFTTAVTGLYVGVVGSYDLQNQAILSSAHNYNYTYIRGGISFVSDINLGNEYGGFPVAELLFYNDHTFAINDLRKDYLFNFGTLWEYMRRENNLNDVYNTDIARSNLDVYSKTEVDNKISLLTKTVEIGDWNMDTTSAIDVLTGVDGKKVRNIFVVIRSDDDALYTPFENGGRISHINLYSESQPVVRLVRDDAGVFDSLSYDSTGGFNRGWVTIHYLP